MNKPANPIVLILKSAKPSRDILKKITDAGYLALVVDSFDDVKCLDYQPGSDRAMMLQSALWAMSTTGYIGDASVIRNRFAMSIIEKLTESKHQPITGD